MSIPTEPWEIAKRRYLEGLTDAEKNLFAAASLESLYDSADAAQKRHQDSSKSRSFFKKLRPLLDTLEQFGAALNTYSNASSTIMCPLWGSIRVLMSMASSFDKYYEKLVDMLARIGDMLPRFSTYSRLYSNHANLLNALSVVYLDIITFCVEAKKLFQRERKPRRLIDLRSFKPMWKAFDRDFSDVIERFRVHKEKVEKEAGLCNMIEAAQERKEQQIERQSALSWRELEMREKKELRQRKMLQALHKVDQMYKHRKISKSRYPNTGGWIAECAVYQDWRRKDSSSCIWCYGIPGCGKTVASTVVVDNLHLEEKNTQNFAVLNYYCDYAEIDTLSSAEFFGNLIRQLLRRISIPQQIEKKLSGLFDGASKNLDEPGLLDLLKAVLDLPEFPAVYIVIDGIDECSGTDRGEILNAIQWFASCQTSTVKLFVTSRADMDISEVLANYPVLKLDSNLIGADIKHYTREMIRKKVKLVQHDDVLGREITEALINGAKGMFLWVALQIEDISREPNERGIRRALKCLPKDLSETYSRALSKIEYSSDVRIGKKVFMWVIGAQRPLLVEEMKEAVAIEPGDTDLGFDKIITDDSSVLRACGNLVTVDDDDRTIRLVHHTVAEYLLSGRTRPKDGASVFFFTRKEADRMMGETVITYLSFSDFGTQIIPAATTVHVTVDPQLLKSVIMRQILGKQVGALTTGWKYLSGLKTGMRTMAHPLGTPARSNDALMAFHAQYNFLSYIRKHWLNHTKIISGMSGQMRKAFKSLVLRRRLPFHFRPWERPGQNEVLEYDAAVDWAFNMQHKALVTVLLPLDIRLWPGSKLPRSLNISDRSWSALHNDLWIYGRKAPLGSETRLLEWLFRIEPLRKLEQQSTPGR